MKDDRVQGALENGSGPLGEAYPESILALGNKAKFPVQAGLSGHYTYVRGTVMV